MSSLRQPQVEKNLTSHRADAASHSLRSSKPVRTQASRHRREVSELSFHVRFTPERVNDLYERSSI